MFRERKIVIVRSKVTKQRDEVTNIISVLFAHDTDTRPLSKHLKDGLLGLGWGARLEGRRGRAQRALRGSSTKPQVN